MKNFGIRGEELVTGIGANAKMNEFAAIMGLCNLNHISYYIEERKKRFEVYESGLAKIKGVRLLNQEKDTIRNYSYMPIVVEDEYPMSRDELYCKLKDNNIFARKYFYPLTSDQDCIRNQCKEAELKCARRISERVLTLPFYPTLGIEVINTILRFIGNV